MMNLPEHLIMEIYEYDGRYKKNYNKLMREIGNLNNKYIITKNTIIIRMRNL